jgi:hypothetical protein
MSLEGKEPQVIVNADAICSCVEKGGNEYDTFEPAIATLRGGSLLVGQACLQLKQFIVKG